MHAYNHRSKDIRRLTLRFSFYWMQFRRLIFSNCSLEEQGTGTSMYIHTCTPGLTVLGPDLTPGLIGRARM